MNRCRACGAAMRERVEEDFDYGVSGLPVTLQGVTVRECTACDEWSVVLPRMKELHAAIARAVVDSRAPLSGPEVRYLRKWLGLLAEEMASLFGVRHETVSRWENGHAAVSPPADRLLRVLVLRRMGEGSRADDLLLSLSEAPAEPSALRLRQGRRGWRLDPAA